MTAWVALLRAVNVGGTGKIEMARLRAAAQSAGFAKVATYIASGNLVFASAEKEAEVRRRLNAAITGEFGVCPIFLLRTGRQMAETAARNPFADADGSKVLVLFAADEPSIAGVRHQAHEVIVQGQREVFIHFPQGMGRSKLVLPAMPHSTGRNMNTVRKLAALAAELA